MSTPNKLLDPEQLIEKQKTFPTELGNAKRFADRYRDDARHCSASGWHFWDGRRWKQDDKKQAIEMMKDVVFSIIDEAKALASQGETDEAKRLFKWALRSQADKCIMASLHQAESEPLISIEADKFDRDPWLLNLRNGTLHLRTFELKPHSREDNITKLSPWEYDPDAKCPEFLKFIERILPDREIRAFVQRWCGYCLTGDNGEQSFFIGYGEGANGKSQLLELLRKLLGPDYATRSTFNTFRLDEHHGETRNDIARLKGIRLVTVSESGEGVLLDESLLKDVTGGEAIAARFLYKEFFTFVPEFKPMFGTNHKPDITGQDYAIWRRVLLVPFDVMIPPGEREENIHARLLRNEASGILNWCLDGLRDKELLGLNPPEGIIAATQDYREEQDIIGHYLTDRYTFGEDYSVPASEIYRVYSRWAKANGYRPVSRKRLGQVLKRKGFKPGFNSTGQVRIWQGLKSKRNDDDLPF